MKKIHGTPLGENRRAFRPDEVAEMIGIGRTKVYELLRSGEIRSVKVGGCRLVTAEAIHELLASHES